MPTDGQSGVGRDRARPGRENGRANGALISASITAGFEVKFVVSNGFAERAAGAGGASATRRVQPRDQGAGPKPDA